MNKNILLVLLLFAGGLLRAQTAAPAASIFFETDQAALSAEAQQTLDALVPALLQAPDYLVNIEAFTDDRGTEQYNLQLAAERAASVQSYLAAKGLVTEKASVKNWGERKAAGPTDLGRQKSRRVDVAIQSFFFEDFFALQDRLSANTEQVLKVQTDQEQTLTANKGTVVIIPANAFVFADGTAPVGPVELVIQEAYNPADFILHNLTTTSDGQILQTGGMVNITARSGGRELRLADGASLIVSIPDGGKFDPNMELFYAQPTANAGVNWVPAGQKFRQKVRSSRVELTIDPALGKRIAAIKVPVYPKPAYPSFKGQMPEEPKPPVAPYKPRAPKKPEWTEVQKMYAGGGEVSRMSRKELKKAQLYFADQEKRYQRDSAKYIQLAERYRQNMEGYERAKLRYAEVHRNWDSELKDRLAALILYQREMRLHFYSISLEKALKTASKTIRNYDTYSSLFWNVNQDVEQKTQFMMLSSGMPTANQLEHGRFVPLNGASVYESVIGAKVIDGYKNFNKIRSEAERALPGDSSYQIIQRMLVATGIKPISDSLQAVIKEKVLLNPQSSEQFNYAMKGYVATVSQLGWINCDRFYSDPAEKMQVQVKEAEDATLYAICKDISAMLPLYRTDQGVYVANGLPKGRQITVISIKIKDGMPQYAQRDMKVGDPILANMNYRSLPLKELKAELEKLNI